MHPKLQAAILVQDQVDKEMLLIIGELEVALSKLVIKQRKVRRYMDLALTRFYTVYRNDPKLLEEYYSRKRNVLFSVAEHHFSEVKKGSKTAALIQHLVSLLKKDGIQIEEDEGSGATNDFDIGGSSPGGIGGGAGNTSLDQLGWSYPKSAAEYSLVKPIRDKDVHKERSGILWKAVCLEKKEMVAIKIVDSSSWSRMGDLPRKIIKDRSKIKSDKMVKFLQVFEENDCTYFVLPLYNYSAFDLTRACPDIPARILICIAKMAILALVELHAEGAVHGKVSMRNIMLVEEEKNDINEIEKKCFVKLTNKTPSIINTIYHRLITSAQDSFSPQGFGKYGNENFGEETEDDEGEMSSSDNTTTGPLSLDLVRSASGGGGIGGAGLTDFVDREDKQKANTAAVMIKSAKVRKAEDIFSVLRMLARIRDMQLRRIKPPDRGFSRSSSSSGVDAELDQWEDLLPYVGPIKVGPGQGGEEDWVEELERIGKLPTLEQLLSKKIFRPHDDPARELGTFLRKKKVLDSLGVAPQLLNLSSSSNNNMRSSMRDSNASNQMTTSRGSRIQSGSVKDLEDAPNPPEELAFSPGSRREKLLARLEDACKRLNKMSKKKSYSARSSPRVTSGKTVGGLIRNNVTHSTSESGRKKGGLAGLFSNSPPTQVAEEFDLDWVAVVIVFFYNKTSLMWKAAKCECEVMEAGKGKWLWRSTRTGIVATLSPNLYFRYLMGSFYDSIHRMNVLQSKLTFDQTATSSTQMYNEFRDHLRRLVRIYFHCAYNMDHFKRHEDDSESGSDSVPASPRTPRSPQQSPRPMKLFSERNSISSIRRLSKEKSPRNHYDGDADPYADRSANNNSNNNNNNSNHNSNNSLSSSDNSIRSSMNNSDNNISFIHTGGPGVRLHVELLWEYLHEFCQIFHVDLNEIEMMKKPLFDT
jgi:hypothetical protein